MKTPPNSPTQYLTACGGEINNPQDYPSAVFQGRQVYFCNKACLRAFEQDPERFMAGEIDHPIEEE